MGVGWNWLGIVSNGSFGISGVEPSCSVTVQMVVTNSGVHLLLVSFCSRLASAPAFLTPQ
jgi:hypothetical protein